MTLIGRFVAFIGRRIGLGEADADGNSPIASFARLPLREQLVLGTRFARGLWLVRKFDTKGLIEAGKGVEIMKCNGEIHMQRLCRLMEGVHVAVVGKNKKAQLFLGDDVGINARTKINVSLSVTIGRGTRIGWDCDIMDSSFHQVKFVDREPGPVDEPVVIEDNVWMGAHCIVLKGVTIGANSVIGAGSVVVKDIPPNSFAAGNPAKVIAPIAGWERNPYKAQSEVTK